MKNLFLLFAATGLLMASCTQNETDGFNSQNPDAIKFSAATSRASISNLATLEGDSDGFTVYGISQGASAWYTNIDGNNNYRYSSGSWGWAGTAAKWPTSAADYPMVFYAVYPQSSSGVMTVTATDPATSPLTGTVTIPSAASLQRDILAAKATATAKPAGGILPLTFKHILSKVNFGIIAGDGFTVNIQKASVVNAKMTGTYDFVAEGWSTPTGPRTFDYFKNTSANFTTTGTSSEDTAVPFYTGNHGYHLMLMPQTTSAWDKTISGLTYGAYIEVIYRIKNASGDYIGYEDANNFLSDHSESYTDGSNTWGSPLYTGIATGNNPYGSNPLYVRVGFPLEITWVPGKGYTYNICLGTAGSTNGYYVDETYYDKDGTDTGIQILGPDDKPVKPGDPIMDGTINFLVKVTEWDDQAATAVQ